MANLRTPVALGDSALSTTPQDLEWEGPGLLGSAWRHRSLLVVATLVGGLLGLVFSALQPVRYEGLASVLLPTPPEAEQPSFDPERYVQNQVELMGSTAVLGEAARRRGGGLTAEEVRESVKVDASQSSDVITVGALDPDPNGAAKLADSVVLAYEDVRAERRKREAEAAIPALHAEQARLRDRLAQLQRAIDADRGNSTLEAERDTVTDRLRQAINDELRLEPDLGARTGAGTALLQQAEVPTSPAQPQRARNVALGALLFLLAAVAAAWTLAGRRAAARAAPVIPALPEPARPPESDKASAAAPAVQAAEDPILTPELIVAFDRLNASLKDVLDTLHVSGWNAIDQSLPQVEAEKAADLFGLAVVAILLDDGDGRFRVAGDVGLSPPERRRALRHDLEPVRAVFHTGPQLLGESPSGRLTRAGSPSSGQVRLAVPLVHDDVGFGLLLASPEPDSDGSTSFDDGEVEAITAFANAIGPTLRSWVMLGRLNLDLRSDRTAPASDGRRGAGPASPG